LLVLLLLLGTFAGAALAQTDATRSTDRIAALEKAAGQNAVAIANAQSAGDNAWMLTSAALVLMMSGPGLALFYGGLVRKKNILGTMMQTFAMMAETPSSGACIMRSCTAWACFPIRIMRPPFRCRPTWCTS
jgi:Amt family ammonium transporter